MEIYDDDVAHAIWMMENQIKSPSDAIRFWKLYGPYQQYQPSPEKATPWWKDLDLS